MTPGCLPSKHLWFLYQTVTTEKQLSILNSLPQARSPLNEENQPITHSYAAQERGGFEIVEQNYEVGAWLCLLRDLPGLEGIKRQINSAGSQPWPCSDSCALCAKGASCGLGAGGSINSIVGLQPGSTLGQQAFTAVSP